MKIPVGNYHDCTLRFIEIEDEYVRVGGMDTAMQRWSLRLEFVDRMRVDGFREGNSILDVQLVAEQEVIEWLRWLYELDPSSGTPEYIDRNALDIAAGRMELLAISPSYGATIAVLCIRVVVE